MREKNFEVTPKLKKVMKVSALGTKNGLLSHPTG
jgi:hypothetical protein